MDYYCLDHNEKIDEKKVFMSLKQRERDEKLSTYSYRKPLEFQEAELELNSTF